MNKQPAPSSLVIVISGAVILIGSFLNFVEFQGDGRNAWGDSLLPLQTLPAILGTLMAIQVALTTWGNVNLPERVLGLDWTRIHLALGIHAALMMISFLIGKFFLSGVSDPDKGIGFWLMLLASLGLAAGAVMRDREPATA